MTTVSQRSSAKPLPTSLDPKETNVELGWERRHPFPHVHRPHEHDRFRLIRMFATSSNPSMRNRAWKLRDCCANPTIRQREDGSTFFSPARCRDRLCPLCAKCDARKTANRVKAAVAMWDAARHLTLTMQSNDKPLVEQIDQLLASFRRLRQRRWWSDRVNGGIGTMEITFNATTKQWHPHIHVLLDGEYLPHAQLKTEWERVTCGSTIVHITAVHSRDDASTYIAKYVSKPSDIAKLDQQSAVELALALVGRRTVIAFGTAHGVRIPVRQQGPDTTGSSHVVTVRAIRKGLEDDFEPARWAIYRLHQETPQIGLWLDPTKRYEEKPIGGCFMVREACLVELLHDCKHWAQEGTQPTRYTPIEDRPSSQPLLWSRGYP